MGWKIRHAVSHEGGCLQVQGRGAAGSQDPGPANGLPRWIQGVRVFCHVCIVFISPPVVELCVLFMHCIICVVCFAPIGSSQGGAWGKTTFNRNFNLKNRRLGGY